MAVHLSKQDLERIITNIEANGGDATALKALMFPQKSQGSVEIPDDELVELKRSQSVVKEGDGLECAICHKPSSRLTADVCDGCFSDWVISCKIKEKHQWKHK
jgi:hypothetical protein